MRIQTLVNFKLKSGKILLAGTYDDSKERFPDEIYREIEKNEDTKDRSRWTLRILDDGKPKSIDNEMTLMDDGANVVETAEPSTPKKKSAPKKAETTDESEETPKKTTKKKSTTKKKRKKEE